MNKDAISKNQVGGNWMKLRTCPQDLVWDENLLLNFLIDRCEICERCWEDDSYFRLSDSFIRHDIGWSNNTIRSKLKQLEIRDYIKTKKLRNGKNEERFIQLNWDKVFKAFGRIEQPEEELPDSWISQTPMKIIEGQGRLY